MFKGLGFRISCAFSPYHLLVKVQIRNSTNSKIIIREHILYTLSGVMTKISPISCSWRAPATKNKKIKYIQ